MVLVLACRVVAVAGESAQAMHHTGHAMAHNAAAEWSEKDDADFLAGMVAHHQGAVAMAKAVENKTRDASVEKWAKDIIASQEQEIETMQALLVAMEFKGEEAAAAMAREMHAMMNMQVSPDPDINFVAGMIPHHAGAIEMSVPALVNSENSRIRQLAKDIITAQAGEIAEFKNWLDQKQ